MNTPENNSGLKSIIDYIIIKEKYMYLMPEGREV